MQRVSSFAHVAGDHEAFASLAPTRTDASIASPG